MSEAFVKTLKRDYLRVSPVPDATTALDQIAGWFDDYNENHPHSGLRMRSPREFRRAHQPAEVSRLERLPINLRHILRRRSSLRICLA
jgi:transposase InsO family protein